MSSPQGRKIAMIGASGHIGGATLKDLLAKKIHTITAIQRPDSTATFAPEVIVKKGALDDEAFLEEAFKGQDVLLIQTAMAGIPLQPGYIRAAAKAGVPYVIPTEFGTDPEAKMIEEFEILKDKATHRKLIQDLGVSSCIAVITNPWFEFCLPGGLFGIHLKERKAILFDGGHGKLTTSTFSRVGAAVTELLSLPESELAKYKNKAFYITSFHVSQREILAAVQRASNTADKDWTIETPTSESIVDKYGEATKKGDLGAWAMVFPMYNFREGWGGDYMHKSDMKKLGFEQEDFDAAVKNAIPPSA